MFTRRILAGLSLVSILGSSALAHPSYIPPSKKLTDEEAKARFLKASAFSYIPSRSGDYFFLPRENYIVAFSSGNYSHDSYSHVKQGRKSVHVQHEGNSHGNIWEYDVHIPILLYGPGFIHSQKRFSQPATQQDLAPTYAKLLQTEPPADAIHGRVLTEALKRTSKKPKAILTLVFDQGGWQYYRANADLAPTLNHYMQSGSLFTEARVSHMEVETSVGHIAIGTGAYPYQHGILANSFFIKPLNRRSSLLGPDISPIFINSPSLSDVYDLKMQNKPLILSYAYAGRAAIGMAGHGAMHSGADKDTVVFYNDKKGVPTTNTRYYHLPDYLNNIHMDTYRQRLLKDGKWMGHTFKDYRDINRTPAQVWFDGDVIMKILENEPIGQDDVTDLAYFTLKATDACGHAFGYESQECRQVFQEQDKQVKRIVEYMEKKVGKENLVVAITADHGASRLPVLANARNIYANDVMAYLNQRLDKLDNGIPVVYQMTFTQLFINHNEMRRNGVSWKDVHDTLMGYRLDGEPMFLGGWTTQEIIQEQLKQGIY